MKKTILALAIIMVFAASSFASVSFMTAPGLGQGKWDLMGAFATDHMGAIAISHRKIMTQQVSASRQVTE